MENRNTDHKGHNYYIMHLDDELEKHKQQSEEKKTKPTKSSKEDEVPTTEDSSSVLRDMYSNDPVLRPAHLRRPNKAEDRQTMYDNVDRYLEIPPKTGDSENPSRDPMDLDEQLGNINFNYDPWKPLIPEKQAEHSGGKAVPAKSVSIDDIPPRGKPLNILPRGKQSEDKTTLPHRTLIISNEETPVLRTSVAEDPTDSSVVASDPVESVAATTTTTKPPHVRSPEITS